MSSHSTNIQFKSLLHQVLKMTPFCSYTGGESCTPLIYRFVSSNAVPHTQQALTQLVDVIYAFLVDLLLHYSPDLIIHGVHIWAVWGPLVGRNSLASLCNCVMCPVHRCTVLLEYEIVTGYFLDAWQQLLLQQYFTIIVAVNFHSRLHKKQFHTPEFRQ